MPKITRILGSEILDSRGNPTVRVKVFLDNGTSGVSSVPSGASTGSHEALELRDNNPKRYKGKGVTKAVQHINTVIAKALMGVEVTEQRIIDKTMCELDGTENKSKFGANAILGASLACAHAGAAAQKKPLYKYIRDVFHLSFGDTYQLPYPTMNIINGGKHADSGLAIQEFMILPRHARFSERVRMGSEIFHSLKSILKKKGFPALVGDEGGFAPLAGSNEKAVVLILAAIQDAGYTAGKDVFLGFDFAASEFYDAEKKRYSFDAGKKTGLTTSQMIDKITQWKEKYPMTLLEDGLAEDDWNGWQELTKKLGKKLMLVGDDLFVTNTKRLHMGIDKKVGNAILIKLNQIGTLSETIDCIVLAQKNHYKVNISHRSGETSDTTIADLAVAVNAEYIKTGSLSRSERVEKYNRLMEIEADICPTRIGLLH
jgi:enolase